jgi:predicted DNA binding CopG/RHH family protein
MQEISSWDKVPKFQSREEEAQYWMETTVQPRLMNTTILKPELRESTTISLRLDPRMLSRLKRLARSRFLNYQSMLKQWLSERLEEELGRPADFGEDPAENGGDK